MVLQAVDMEDAPGFVTGPDEVEYRVAEPAFRVRAAAGVASRPSAGWIEVIRRLREEGEISLPG